MKVAIASSNLFNPYKAGYAIAKKVHRELHGIRPNVLLLYGSIRYDYEEVFDGILSIFDDESIPLMGGTGYGTACQDSCSNLSLVLIGIHSEELNVSIGKAERVSVDSYRAGIKAASQAKEILGDLNATICLAHSDGIEGNGAAILRGIQQILGIGTPVCGGTTGDDVQFKKAYQFFNWKCLSDHVVVLLFAGNIEYKIDIIHGWLPFGAEGYLENYKGPIISKLKSGITIQEFYRQRLGSHLSIENFSLYPLAVYQPNEQDFILRAAMHFKDDGSMVFAGDFPTNTSFIRVCKSNQIKILQMVSSYMEQNYTSPSSPNLVLYYSCGARKIILGNNTKREIENVQKALGYDTPVAGFFTFGEFAPFKYESSYGPSLMHNQTLVLCALWSK